MGATTEVTSSEAVTDGMREYQEYLSSQPASDTTLEAHVGMPIQHIRPIEVESRHQAGLLVAGLSCGITTEMPTIAGVFIRIYGVDDVSEAIEGLKSPENATNAPGFIQEMAAAISVGRQLYTPREFGQLVAHFIDDEDRALLAASLASARR